MGRRKKPPIADRDEVLAVITSIMRREMTEEAVRKVAGGEERVQVPPKISEVCKAAEMLGRELGLFEGKEEAHDEAAHAEVLCALIELRERLRGGGA